LGSRGESICASLVGFVFIIRMNIRDATTFIFIGVGVEHLVLVIRSGPIIFLVHGYVLVGIVYIIKGMFIECSFDSQHYIGIFIIDIMIKMLVSIDNINYLVLRLFKQVLVLMCLLIIYITLVI
jgi:hypothetical protein